MPISPGRIAPRDMDDRQWTTWAASQRALPNRDVRQFTPTWSGFTVAPTGDISFVDMGSMVVMFIRATTTGTAVGATFMRIDTASIPEEIRPIDGASGICTVIADDGSGGVIYSGIWAYSTAAGMGFGFLEVLSAPGTVLRQFSLPLGTKGLPAGWYIIYPK